MGKIDKVHIKRYEKNIKRIEFEIESLSFYMQKKKEELEIWKNARHKK